jgi:uncharacterized protein (TIGR00730 family)
MTNLIRRICVFCGSRTGLHEAYGSAAAEIGRLLARQGIGLVYGGGKVGLMGRLADGALAERGRVIGVIPHHLEAKEVAHHGLTELRVVETMHVRKATMADLSDAFIALPGGLGTLDELFEVATWSQLGLHAKPIGLLNTRGYFDLLADYLEHAVKERFIEPAHRDSIIIRRTPSELLDALLVSPTRGAVLGLDPPAR